MKYLTTDILILGEEDKRFADADLFNSSNLYLNRLNFNCHDKIRSASLVLFIDNDGNTTILKNRFGKHQTHQPV